VSYWAEFELVAVGGVLLGLGVVVTGVEVGIAEV
jgi:hypothetical protein